MALKMNELVRLSNTPKSTILYYIKEGLLPEPQKIKPNVHLYDESFVERIEFIKYLQNNFHATIDQIKTLIKRNDFDFTRGFESALDMMEILTAPSCEKLYSEEEFCSVLNISIQKLQQWLQEGAIFKRGDGFSEKEVEIGATLLALERYDPDGELLSTYIDYSKKMAETEVKMAKKILNAQKERKGVAKTLFDATLILKPYLLNMHLIDRYRKSGDEK